MVRRGLGSWWRTIYLARSGCGFIIMSLQLPDSLPSPRLVAGVVRGRWVACWGSARFIDSLRLWTNHSPGRARRFLRLPVSATKKIGRLLLAWDHTRPAALCIKPAWISNLVICWCRQLWLLRLLLHQLWVLLHLDLRGRRGKRGRLCLRIRRLMSTSRKGSRKARRKISLRPQRAHRLRRRRWEGRRQQRVLSRKLSLKLRKWFPEYCTVITNRICDWQLSMWLSGATSFTSLPTGVLHMIITVIGTPAHQFHRGLVNASYRSNYAIWKPLSAQLWGPPYLSELQK